MAQCSGTGANDASSRCRGTMAEASEEMRQGRFAHVVGTIGQVRRPRQGAGDRRIRRSEGLAFALSEKEEMEATLEGAVPS